MVDVERIVEGRNLFEKIKKLNYRQDLTLKEKEKLPMITESQMNLMQRQKILSRSFCVKAV